MIKIALRTHLETADFPGTGTYTGHTPLTIKLYITYMLLIVQTRDWIGLDWLPNTQISPIVRLQKAGRTKCKRYTVCDLDITHIDGLFEALSVAGRLATGLGCIYHISIFCKLSWSQLYNNTNNDL